MPTARFSLPVVLYVPLSIPGRRVSNPQGFYNAYVPPQITDNVILFSGKNGTILDSVKYLPRVLDTVAGCRPSPYPVPFFSIPNGPHMPLLIPFFGNYSEVPPFNGDITLYYPYVVNLANMSPLPTFPYTLTKKHDFDDVFVRAVLSSGLSSYFNLLSYVGPGNTWKTFYQCKK
jgi:hypothetical protein